MTIIKCKMCGGDIELTADKTFGTCEFCGSTTTLPRIDDEQRAAAFNRGNHFRRIGEFDKALAVYERIIRENDTDAEAHWCAALCRFGIEYVEDPVTYEWIPTCHRASFDSFLEDVDLKAAVEHSDGLTRRLYQKEAAKIAEIQRGILATSQNTEPYDVFICYKESDEDGQRTRDSLMAQDIYYQLTDQGHRVFFSRITLEDIPGAQYEPYIFAALNSAKVMVAVGTKPEHFSAVWVRNEWSRFLALMRKDHSRVLLPCYRDMDPYDLPEQLAVLQSYDMGKIGFIQDLIRGVDKVVKAGKAPVIINQVQEAPQAAGSSVSALLDRGYMALEDGEWSQADSFFENVLNQDARCARAYLGKMLAQLQLSGISCLSDCKRAVITNNHYQKALRFGDEALVNTLQTQAKNNREAMQFHADNLLRAGGWISAVKLYDQILEEDKTYVSAYVGKLLAEIKLYALEELDSYPNTSWESNPNYAQIVKYGDATLLDRFETSKAKIISKMKQELASKEIYDRAVLMATNTADLSYLERLYGGKAEKRVPVEDLIAAVELLDTIPDYRDASALAASYRSRIEDIQREQNYRKAALASNSVDPVQLENAIRIFETISDYKDAAARIHECRQRIQRLREKEREEDLMRRNLCRHCGREFKGLFSPKCASCGKPKDY